MQEYMQSLGILVLYFVVLASLAGTYRVFGNPDDEIFRKILHFILLGSLPVFLFCFATWKGAVAAALGFAVVVYPLLHFAERIKGFSHFFHERKGGEIKKSLLLVFGMFAVVIAVCWGYFDDRLLAMAGVYAWGIGDALAAIIGKRYGKHKIRGRFLDGKKSLEGSGGMFSASFFSVFGILLLRGGPVWYLLMGIALITALVTTLVELYAKEGNDTVYCPLAATTVMLLFLQMFSDL